MQVANTSIIELRQQSEALGRKAYREHAHSNQLSIDMLTGQLAEGRESEVRARVMYLRHGWILERQTDKSRNDIVDFGYRELVSDDKVFFEGLEMGRQAYGNGCEDIVIYDSAAVARAREFQNDRGRMVILYDGWIAGWNSGQYDPGLVSLREEAKKNNPGYLEIDTDKFLYFVSMYETGDSPESGDRAEIPYRAYKQVMDSLKACGNDECCKCLTCLGLYAADKVGEPLVMTDEQAACDRDCIEVRDYLGLGFEWNINVLEKYFSEVEGG